MRSLEKYYSWEQTNNNKQKKKKTLQGSEPLFCPNKADFCSHEKDKINNRSNRFMQMRHTTQPKRVTDYSLVASAALFQADGEDGVGTGRGGVHGRGAHGTSRVPRLQTAHHLLSGEHLLLRQTYNLRHHSNTSLPARRVND